MQPYKYNGKELDTQHGLNMYDYSARYYEPAMGRFTSVDPHAENYFSWSPYAYCGNNPINLIDPTGMDTVPSNEIWEHNLINYRSNGNGIHDADNYSVVTNDNGDVFHLHAITSGENEGNYVAIQQYGTVTMDIDGESTQVPIYEFKYVVGKDKVDDFKNGDTKGSGYMRGNVKAAVDGGLDGRKNIGENMIKHIKNQWSNPLQVLFDIGTPHPLSPGTWPIKIGKGTQSAASSMKNMAPNIKNRSITSPIGTRSNPLKGKEIQQRLKR